MGFLRRLAGSVVLLWVLSVVLFWILHAMPGTPRDLLLSADPSLSGERIARFERLHGLDRPILTRYACWLIGRSHTDDPAATCAWWPGDGLLFGDLGYSRVHKVPVAEILGERVERSAALMVPAFVLALLLAIGLGVLAATRAGRLTDRLISGLVIAGLAIPTHWLAMVAILIFAVALGWLPAGGIDDPRDPSALQAIRHAILPVSILALHFGARWTRVLRASMLEVLGQDFIRTARAKGLDERAVLLRHALPNAMLPLFTVVTQSLPGLFSGALITERVFSYPGMGVLIWESIEGNDYFVAITAFLIFAALTMAVTLLQDLLYPWLDPRTRSGAGGVAALEASK